MQDRCMFRGKQLDNGGWIIGYLWVNRTATRETYYITDDYGDIQRVDPATIGQCTGLEDKNGKLIFEGDIFKVPFFEGIVIVEWDNEGGRFLGFTHEHDRRIVYVGRDPQVEIIGNIHDNPELLKVDVNSI